MFENNDLTETRQRHLSTPESGFKMLCMTDTTNAPPQADLWTLVKRDYLAGDTADILSERYGVSVRTLRRVSAEQKWRRRDRTWPGGIHDGWPGEIETHVYGPRRTRLDVARNFPELDQVERVNAQDADQLLLTPNPGFLRHFAFKRAPESAALDRPTQCLAWMRVVTSLDRSGDRIEQEDWGFSTADRLRAAFVHSINRATADSTSDANADDTDDDGDGVDAAGG